MLKGLRIILRIVLITVALFYIGCLIYYNLVQAPKQTVTSVIVPGVHSSRLNWVPVRWESSAISDRGFMLLPLYVDTIQKPFWVQFDLGIPTTALSDISSLFPHLKKEQRNNKAAYTNLTIRIGKDLPYHAAEMPVEEEPVDSLAEKDSLYDTKIGNLGFDFIRGRILIIDYKNSRIAITDTLPENFNASVEYFPGALVNQFPIFLPVIIDGKTKLALFDTGSSAFTLWTSPGLWNEWRDKTRRTDTFTGTSWGRREYYYKSYPKQEISIINKDCTHLPIWGVTKNFTSRNSFLSRIKKFTDWQFGKTVPATIGNEYFRDDVLVFDTRNNGFGRLKSVPFNRGMN